MSLTFTQIIQDIECFKRAAFDHSLRGYCLFGSYILNKCLQKHNLESYIIEGYLIINNQEYVRHYWVQMVDSSEVFDLIWDPFPVNKRYELEIRGDDINLYPITSNMDISLEKTYKIILEEDDIVVKHHLYETTNLMSKQMFYKVFDEVKITPTFKYIEEINPLICGGAD